MGVFRTIMKVSERQLETVDLMQKKKCYLKQRIKARQHFISMLEHPTTVPILPAPSSKEQCSVSISQCDLDETHIYTSHRNQVVPML
jgi:hypothetical protein